MAPYTHLQPPAGAQRAPQRPLHADMGPITAYSIDHRGEVNCEAFPATGAIRKRVIVEIIELPDRVHGDRVCDRALFSHALASRRKGWSPSRSPGSPLQAERLGPAAGGPSPAQI